MLILHSKSEIFHLEGVFSSVHLMKDNSEGRRDLIEIHSQMFNENLTHRRTYFIY